MRRSLIWGPLVFLAFVGSQTALGGTPSAGPSEEEVARSGFAVWPEDSVEEAQQACNDRVDDQPWRLSPTETALQFARVKLDHEEPEVDEEMSDVGHDEARVWLMAPEVSLSNIFELRRYDTCWYITRGDEREDGVGASVVFAEDSDTRKVYLEHWDRGSTAYEEIGFGPHLEKWGPTRSPTRRSWTLPETATEEGHVLVVDWDAKGDLQGGEGVYARPLPAPPVFGEGERVFPVGERFTWDEVPREDRKRSCRMSSVTESEPRRVLNYMLQWVFSDAMPSGPYPDAIRIGAHGWIGDRVRVDKLATGRWRVKIDDVRYRVVAIKGAEDCWALEKWVPIDKERPLEEAYLAESSATVDFRWGGAGRTSVSVGYSSVHDGVLVHDYVPSRVAFYRLHEDDYEYPVPVAGRALVVQSKRGRYVNAYARLLPPAGDSSP